MVKRSFRAPIEARPNRGTAVQTSWVEGEAEGAAGRSVWRMGSAVRISAGLYSACRNPAGVKRAGVELGRRVLGGLVVALVEGGLLELRGLVLGGFVLRGDVLGRRVARLLELGGLELGGLLGRLPELGRPVHGRLEARLLELGGLDLGGLELGVLVAGGL